MCLGFVYESWQETVEFNRKLDLPDCIVDDMGVIVVPSAARPWILILSLRFQYLF